MPKLNPALAGDFEISHFVYQNLPEYPPALPGDECPPLSPGGEGRGEGEVILSSPPPLHHIGVQGNTLNLTWFGA